jgi:uncharacterized coiled-coil DUF342 family protein
LISASNSEDAQLQEKQNEQIQDLTEQMDELHNQASEQNQVTQELNQTKKVLKEKKDDKIAEFNQFKEEKTKKWIYSKRSLILFLVKILN